MLNVGRKDRAKDGVTQDQIPYPFPTDTTKTYTFTPGTGFVPAAVGGGAPLLMHVQDQKANGTVGGTPVSGKVITSRDLNTVLINQIGSASLSVNNISLPAGSYYVEAFSPFYNTSQVRIGVYNNTDSVFLAQGTGLVFPNIEGSFLAQAGGYFVLSTTKSISLKYRANTSTGGTTGLGFQANMGENEIYSDLKIWKLA